MDGENFTVTAAVKIATIVITEVTITAVHKATTVVREPVMKVQLNF